MKQLAIFLILLLSFMGCKKIHLKKREKLKGDKEVLVGTYEWDSTFWKYEYYPSNYSPSTIDSGLIISNTINTTYQIEFLKKGIVRYYKNKVLINEYDILKISTYKIDNKQINYYKLKNFNLTYYFGLYVENTISKKKYTKNLTIYINETNGFLLIRENDPNLTSFITYYHKIN